jgi:hypothetical protein
VINDSAIGRVYNGGDAAHAACMRSSRGGNAQRAEASCDGWRRIGTRTAAMLRLRQRRAAVVMLCEQHGYQD